MGCATSKKPRAEAVESKEQTKDQIKEQKRLINRSKVSIEREITKLENTLNKTMLDIKSSLERKEPRQIQRKLAEQCKKLQTMITKFSQKKAQFINIGFQMDISQTNQALMNVMKEMSNVMKIKGEGMDIKQFQKIVNDFNTESEKQTMTQEKIQEIFDIDEDVDEDYQDKEIEDLINQIDNKVGKEKSEQKNSSNSQCDYN